MIVDSVTKTTAPVDCLIYVLRQGQFIIVREEKSLGKAKQKLQHSTSQNCLHHKRGCVKARATQAGRKADVRSFQ